MGQKKRIAEGFRGQRLVVVPSLVRERSRTHPLLKGLFVTDAGIFNHAKLHYIERKDGITTNLLIACLAGRGWIRLADKSVQVITPGMVAWLPAHQAHAYGSAKRDPWSIEWAHFEGEEADAWRELLGIPLTGGSLKMSPAKAGELHLGEVWAQLDQGYSTVNLTTAASCLRNALARAAQQKPVEKGQADAAQRVAASIAWMKGRLDKPLRVKELASHSGLSVPHYTVLFRRQTGFSPMDWFARLRVQWACELLDTTPHRIAEIARQTGYSDPYYFTRCFRRVVGVPPRRYRRVPKG